MPRDNDKNNDSRGRRDRPSGGGKGRSGAARGPEKKFAKRGFAGKSDGERRPYAGKSDGRQALWQKASIRVRASPTPASVRAPRRASTGMMRRAAKSAPIPRARIAAMPARPRDFPTGNSATRNLTHRGTAVARNGPIPRAAKASARTATVPREIGRREIAPIVHGRRVTVTVPVAIVPSESLAATRNFRAVHRTEVRARISVAGIAKAPRGIARATARTVASPSRGRNATPARPIMSGATRARRATAREVSTSRVSKSPVLTNRVRTGAAIRGVPEDVLRSAAPTA